MNKWNTLLVARNISIYICFSLRMKRELDHLRKNRQCGGFNYRLQTFILFIVFSSYFDFAANLARIYRLQRNINRLYITSPLNVYSYYDIQFNSIEILFKLLVHDQNPRELFSLEVLNCYVSIPLNCKHMGWTNFKCALTL